MARETVLSDAESVYDQTEAVEMGVEEKPVVAKEEEKSVEEEEASTLVEKEPIPEIVSSFEEKSGMEEKEAVVDEKMNTVEKPSTPPMEEKQEVQESTPTERTMEETKNFTLQINGVSIRVSERVEGVRQLLLHQQQRDRVQCGAQQPAIQDEHQQGRDDEDVEEESCERRVVSRVLRLRRSRDMEWRWTQTAFCSESERVR